MLVYRIGKTKFANDLTGEGARLNGGRWNHRLTPCIYTSESRALALLEYTVNVHADDIPRALSIITLDISLRGILQLALPGLPGNWQGMPAPASTKDIGTRILKELHYAVIKVPSAVLPQEFNYILNPLLNLNGRFKIISIDDMAYDVRIKSQ